MTLSTYIIIMIIAVLWGLSYTIKIYWYQIGLYLITQDIKNLNDENIIYEKINNKINNLLTINKIKEIGKIELHLEVLKLLNEKTKLTMLYTKGLREIEHHLERLERHRLPSSNQNINILIKRWKSILLTSQTDDEKFHYLVMLIEKFEGHLFFLIHYPNNYNEDDFELSTLKDLTEKDLQIVNFVIRTFNNKNIVYYEKLKVCEDFRISVLLNRKKNYNLL